MVFFKCTGFSLSVQLFLVIFNAYSFWASTNTNSNFTFNTNIRPINNSCNFRMILAIQYANMCVGRFVEKGSTFIGHSRTAIRDYSKKTSKQTILTFEFISIVKILQFSSFQWHSSKVSTWTSFLATNTNKNVRPAFVFSPLSTRFTYCCQKPQIYTVHKIFLKWNVAQMFPFKTHWDKTFSSYGNFETTNAIFFKI